MKDSSDLSWSFREIQRINAICDEFRQAWIEQLGPVIEDFLVLHSELPHSALLLELVHLERDLRCGAGDSPEQDEYLRRFPDDLEIIGEAWRLGATSQVTALTETASTTIPHFNSQPAQLGRFKILRKLGIGGFGVVYLARDPLTERDVALKVPHHLYLLSPEQRTEIKKEALIGKNLDHPHLVKTLEFEDESEPVFIVQQFIEGSNLSEWHRKNRLNQYQVAEIMIPIAQAMGYLHEQGYTHRDLKPANVLIDKQGIVYVSDFGLTLHEDEQRTHKREMAGTLPYMSPEQVTRQRHLLDGQSDIWSCGVILYVLLTDRLPFGGRPPTSGSTEFSQYLHDLRDEICDHDPKPPRMICPGLSRKLQEICLRCLEKRKRHRYQSGYDLADDLALFLEKSGDGLQPSDPQRAIRIVPKGLRSFDAADAEFFLELLPGPRSSAGLPSSVSFWKNRLSGITGTLPIDVGVVYGPSGSGKSSLIKAGLLPVLGDNFVPLVIEATGEETEVRLLKALRQTVPGLPATDSLVEICRHVGEHGMGDGRRILLVFDQFEQLLQSHPDLSQSQLLAGLKNCNRTHLQALFLVRDDFWMPLTRFLDRMEISLQENNNIAAVDLFDRDHARKILIAFGQAYERLPKNDELTDAQNQFLENTIEGLTQDGRIICVRLALFVEMMKDRPWTPAELAAVGGAEGIGVAFLEQKFGRHAQSVYRPHCMAAKKVLDRLLPPYGSDLKGQMRSVDELRTVAGYSTPRAFVQLIQILNSDLKLLTPATLENADGRPDDSGAEPTYYQLTHDYLVPSIREWLFTDLSRTRAGRAQLRLRERAEDWNRQPESRRLPSLVEWLSIWWHVPNRTWSIAQHRTMQAATWVHGIRWITVLLTLLVLGLSIHGYLASQDAVLTAHKQEGQRKQAQLLVDAVLAAPAEAVPYAIDSLEQFKAHAVPMLQQFLDSNTTDQHQRLRSASVLAHFGDVRNDFLIKNIGTAQAGECETIVQALKQSPDDVTGRLLDHAKLAEGERIWSLKARCAIALLHLGNTVTASEMMSIRADPMQRIKLIDEIRHWHGDLNRLIAMAGKSDDRSLRSGICLGIGSISPDNFSPADIGRVQATISGWYHNSQDLGTRSAAEWMLRQWNQPIPPPAERTDPDSLSRDWRTNSIGMTMFKIPLPTSASDPNATPAKPYWLSHREVSRGLYQKFIDDPNLAADQKPQSWNGADTARSSTIEHPVQQVSWIDAVLFCNWLSHFEHLHPCYNWTDSAWKLDPHADGYRLPTEYEWELACRAGTTTRFVSGDDDSYLRWFATYESNCTTPCGSKMPNGWGLFDLHGNVYEWCRTPKGNPNDGESEDLGSAGQNGMIRMLRGGAFDYSSFKAEVGHCEKAGEKYRSFTIGFRPARND